MAFHRFIIFFGILLVSANVTVAQTGGGSFRIGEKLSYAVSFERFRNVAYLETSVVSRGLIGGREVIELQGKAKTFDIVSATFPLLDESRVVLVAPESGLPLLINRSIRSTAVPRDVVSNFLTTPTTNFDLLSVIFKMRESNGSGSFPFTENGENFVATFAPLTGEKLSGRIRTDAGEFETTAVSMQSTYLDTLGIKTLRIDLSNDEFRVPVRFRIETTKGSFIALLSALRIEPVATPADAPPLVPEATPKPQTTPRPVATPTPYQANQPLLRELKFSLGEALDYRVTQGNQTLGTFRLAAKERVQVDNADTLLLTATVTQVLPSNRAFGASDTMVARVNPDTLAPRSADYRLSQSLATINQRFSFNPQTGAISFGSSTVEAPVGTHTLMSLLWAMRSFNLQTSRTNNAPVNDTRVAVFWRDKANVFSLRPEIPGSIVMEGKPIPAQLVAITTGVPELDSLQLKVWLSLDDSRIPLRIIVGTYQADLYSASVVAP